MAQKQTVSYVSDLSGKEIDGTEDGYNPSISFSFDGTDYTIDLTADEFEKFSKAMRPYMDAGTKVGRRSGTKSRAKQSGPTAADIRGWAKEHGYDVPERGRIPADVRAAFDAAN